MSDIDGETGVVSGGAANCDGATAKRCAANLVQKTLLSSFAIVASYSAKDLTPLKRKFHGRLPIILYNVRFVNYNLPRKYQCVCSLCQKESILVF